jgi:hypothetical protein
MMVKFDVNGQRILADYDRGALRLGALVHVTAGKDTSQFMLEPTQTLYCAVRRAHRKSRSC